MVQERAEILLGTDNWFSEERRSSHADQKDDRHDHSRPGTSWRNYSPTAVAPVSAPGGGEVVGQCPRFVGAEAGSFD
jgi:hypothetical protein